MMPVIILQQRSIVTICILAVLGFNQWGQDGRLKCTKKNPDGCRGSLLCLPHPYGCSCAAGYEGLDCDQGKYNV